MIMRLQEAVSLRPFNTFSIDVKAKLFSAFDSESALKQLLAAYPKENKCILGGGSNILFTKNLDGLCLKNEIRGIALIREDENFYYVKAAAGEQWHHFVLHCIENNYAGVENLSLIPGCVGASPMQNIGAYGVEIKDVFYTLEALHIKDLTTRIFNKEDCRFGYRESIFKRELKGQYVILNVTYRLRKKPIFHLDYGALEAALEQMQVATPTIAAVSQAVIQIRESKLPDPAKIGNAGSFFKNPTIETQQFNKLKERFPAIVGYPSKDDQTKVAAGWLIEACGWKGYRKQDYGVHQHQALVLVNYAHATGREIYALSEQIIESVFQKFGITLEREVNII